MNIRPQNHDLRTIFRIAIVAVFLLFAWHGPMFADDPKTPSTPASAGSAAQAQPMRLLFDTDMGNDIDDALALGVIHSLATRRECQLLAVTVSKDNPLAARFCDIVNLFYGYGDRTKIPVGIVHNGQTPEEGKFLPAVVNAMDRGRPRYEQSFKPDEEIPDATLVLRKALSAQPDKSVTLVVVGFSTNIARLLESKPDDASPLDGRALVEQKVALLSMMAGHFGANGPKDFKEYNIKIDLDASTTVFEKWPTPIVVSGFEIGESIPYPATSIEKDYNYVPHHPLKEGYESYLPMPYERPTWDLTSVLHAVRPDRGYFNVSEPGEIRVVDGGVTVFKPGGHGRHRYLTVTPNQIVRVKEALIMLASEPPKRPLYKYTYIDASPASKSKNDK